MQNMTGLRLRAGVLLTAITAGLSSVTAGCQRPSPAATPEGQQAPAATGEVAVRVVKPERKTIRHPIEQPGFNIQAFQETPLYAKISGYVQKWDTKIDIGSAVHKD